MVALTRQKLSDIDFDLIKLRLLAQGSNECNMKRRIFVPLILMTMALLMACDGEFPLTETPTVSGEVTNVENDPIPEGATLTVQIQDNSLQDATSPVIGEQIIENPDEFPIPYQVGYNPDDIRSPNYTMSAQIRAADGSLLFTDTMNIPVITGGNPTEDVEIPVVQVGE